MKKSWNWDMLPRNTKFSKTVKLDFTDINQIPEEVVNVECERVLDHALDDHLMCLRGGVF